MAFKSSSGSVIGLMSKFFTSVSSTLGVRNAGSEGPRRIPLMPKCSKANPNSLCDTHLQLLHLLPVNELPNEIAAG